MYDMADWVLSKFAGEDLKTITEAIRKAADAVECLGRPLIRLHDPVAHAHLRENILGLRRIFFNLPADIGHVDPKDPVVVFHVGPPDLLDDGIIGHHLPGIFPQKADDLILVLGQSRIGPVHKYPVLIIVDGESAGYESARGRAALV